MSPWGDAELRAILIEVIDTGGLRVSASRMRAILGADLNGRRRVTDTAKAVVRKTFDDLARARGMPDRRLLVSESADSYLLTCGDPEGTPEHKRWFREWTTGT
jgi:hypothetical protein